MNAQQKGDGLSYAGWSIDQLFGSLRSFSVTVCLACVVPRVTPVQFKIVSYRMLPCQSPCKCCFEDAESSFAHGDSRLHDCIISASFCLPRLDQCLLDVIKALVGGLWNPFSRILQFQACQPYAPSMAKGRHHISLASVREGSPNHEAASRLQAACSWFPIAHTSCGQ